MLTTTQIESLATDMGCTVDEARKILGLDRGNGGERAPLKALRENSAFSVVITKATNKIDKYSGKPQVQLSFQVLDGNDQPIPGAFGTTWVGYGLNRDGFKYADIEAQERDLKAQKTILKASGDARFAEPTLADANSKPKVYVDADGEKLAAEQVNAMFTAARVNAINELAARASGNGGTYVGTKLVARYSTYEYTNKSTGEKKTGKKFELSTGPGKLPLVDNAGDVFAEGA